MAIKVRVATEGKTVDGREITAEQIDQMAASYNPDLYGARIWNEHLRTLLPEGTFQAYGDVLSVSADNVDGKRTLFAELDPTPELIEINRKRQKVFTSIEMNTNFQGKGHAYLMGLAVTDTPASTGTEMLKFSIENKNENVENSLFSEFSETDFPDTDDKPQSAGDPTILDKVKSIFSRSDKKFTQAEDAILHLSETVAKQADQMALLSDKAQKQVSEIETLSNDLSRLSDELAVFKKAIDTDIPAGTGRPEHNGANEFSTDC